MKLSIEAFLSRPFDPLHYYNVLPSDDLRIDGARPAGPVSALREQLLATQPGAEAIPLMDALSIALINEFDSLAGDENWRPLADRMAEWYACMLRPGGSKPVRMRAQLLNFFLRDVLDAGRSTGEATSEQIEALCPWDFLRLPGEDIWITNDSENVIRQRRDGTEVRLRCGLPTRLDSLADGRIGVHSLYSNGGWLIDGEQTIEVPHDTPIILFFLRAGRLHFIDFSTRVFDATVRRQLAGPFLEQAHFARMVGDRLFLIDCCQIGRLYEFNAEPLTMSRHEIAPILICNDLCRAGDRFYAVDKEQGCVFSFDDRFNFLESRLAFGRAPGRLWDPVAIRNVNGRLQVLNWFTGSLVTLDPF